MWRKRPAKTHPLVWQHRSGRRSLVLGATTDHVVGMGRDEGRALLDDLLARATEPERVYRHEWNVGDVVIWDNRGVLHRACPYDPTSPRDMHRTTFAGDEAIQ
jgi:alpha-ketoglutarate-dependent taurine dioxygenase